MIVPFRTRAMIIVFGDSLTQFGWGCVSTGVQSGQQLHQVGWVSMLASAYTRRADILNRGFSGYNTRHALEILPRMFRHEKMSISINGSNDLQEKDDQQVLFCTVFFGANDAALPGESQHVPLEEYQFNLGEIVKYLKEQGIRVILLTPPPVDEVRWKAEREQTVSDRQNTVTRKYAAACLQVAEDHDCIAVNVFELLGGNGCGFSEHLSDGVHLSGSGNALVYEHLLQLIHEKYPHLAPMGGDGKNEKSGIPMEEALWRDLC